jgi:hypothetical protein
MAFSLQVAWVAPLAHSRLVVMEVCGMLVVEVVEVLQTSALEEQHSWIVFWRQVEVEELEIIAMA